MSKAIILIKGKRTISREITRYNLEAVIAIGFKVNSERAIEFRRWANRILKDFSIRGYALDSERLKSGAYLSKQCFDKEVKKLIKNDSI